MSDTSIEWTERTWNPVAGCSIVSPGCHNCYAMRMAGRLAAMGQEKYVGTTRKTNGRTLWTGTLRMDYDALTLPLKWAKPKRIFVNSMSDLFHEGVPDDFIRRVFAVMSFAGQHTFQILTKRPERMAAWFADEENSLSSCQAEQAVADDYPRTQSRIRNGRSINGTVKGVGDGNYWPLPNVWLGVSVEDQKRTERIEHLLKTPAAVRFVSAEPLLGSVDFGLRNWAGINRDDCRLDWLIVGGESGPGARPCRPEWIRSISRDCQIAGVPVFVKQLGANVVTRNDMVEDTFSSLDNGWPDPEVEYDIHGFRENCRIRLRDKKGGDPLEWPHDLRIRQMPRYQGARA